MQEWTCSYIPQEGRPQNLTDTVRAANYFYDTMVTPSQDTKHPKRLLNNSVMSMGGTNITKHIDLFEKICGQLAHDNPANPPTEEQRIDWFLETVHEKTYDAVHASCVDKHLEGKLTFAKL
jgi:hypothetical protein